MNTHFYFITVSDSSLRCYPPCNSTNSSAPQPDSCRVVKHTLLIAFRFLSRAVNTHTPIIVLFIFSSTGHVVLSWGPPSLLNRFRHIRLAKTRYVTPVLSSTMNLFVETKCWNEAKRCRLRGDHHAFTGWKQSVLPAEWISAWHRWFGPCSRCPGMFSPVASVTMTTAAPFVFCLRALNWRIMHQAAAVCPHEHLTALGQVMPFSLSW